MAEDRLDDEVRITLRLPARLRDALIKSANESSRSMNGEIVNRLDESLGIERAEASFHRRQQETERKMLYVVLDADGHPVSWQSVMGNLARIAENSQGEVRAIDAVVISPTDEIKPWAREYDLVEDAPNFRQTAKSEGGSAIVDRPEFPRRQRPIR
ncbi:Arc family DNA-binding protein [Mesorhizobium sp. KR1-2]|uniref:Arc family DNA-binding protein n=1 Tax=Mesorhizobium sp. KR1-2 TaxID=3156609 RepID=UPI0032B34AC7